MKKIKLILYWVSVVPVIIDLVKGAINGVNKGLQDIKEQEQQALWLKVNKPND